MKNKFNKVLMGLTMTGALFFAGCAGGDGSRSTGEMIDDTAIHTKVKAALVNDPVITGRAIDVDVTRGTVLLTGAVNSDDESKKAENTAWGVRGVRAVTNNLVVRGADLPSTSTNTTVRTTSP